MLDLGYSLVAGAEVDHVLPCGVAVRIRALSPADRDGARARATRRTRIDPAFGQQVASIIARQAARLVEQSAHTTEGGEISRMSQAEAEARVLRYLAQQDAEAHAAYEDLRVWLLEVSREVCAAGLVRCEALGLEAPTPEATLERLRAIRRPEAQAVLVGELYQAVVAWSEAGELGKAPPEPRSGSTSSSGETSGGAGAPTATGAASI